MQTVKEARTANTGSRCTTPNFEAFSPFSYLTQSASPVRFLPVKTSSNAQSVNFVLVHEY